jgi:hypothetical protein
MLSVALAADLVSRAFGDREHPWEGRHARASGRSPWRRLIERTRSPKVGRVSSAVEQRFCKFQILAFTKKLSSRIRKLYCRQRRDRLSQW